jgi:hypothetical protein
MIKFVELDQGSQVEIVDGEDRTGIAFEVFFTAAARPAKAPEGWIVFNALRPLYGTLGPQDPVSDRPIAETWEDTQGRLTGIHFAAVDPKDPDAMDWIKYNANQDAVIVEYDALSLKDRDPRTYRYNVEILREFADLLGPQGSPFWAWSKIDAYADPAHAVTAAQDLRDDQDLWPTPGVRVVDVYTAAAADHVWVSVDGDALRGRPIHWRKLGKVVR